MPNVTCCLWHYHDSTTKPPRENTRYKVDDSFFICNGNGISALLLILRLWKTPSGPTLSVSPQSRRASHSSKLSNILLQPSRDSVRRSVGGTDNHGIQYTKYKSSLLNDRSEGTGVKQNSRQRTGSPHFRQRYHPRTRSVASVQVNFTQHSPSGHATSLTRLQ
jgi:hypothetical protein